MKKLAIAFVLLLAISCTHVNDGTVVSKEFTPSHTIITPITHRVGKTSFTTWQPIYYPDRWYVTVQDSEGNSESWNVTKEYYDKTHIGEHVWK